ncbi:MAG TPA: VOC family protein [Anaerolineales bacterium]|nr:VOC family protein [Anaerolineales bacterium]
MQFTQIQHCSVVVQSLERAAAFYRDVLGLTEIEIPSTFKPAGLKVRWFRLGSQQIHILLGAENRPSSQGHMALQVDDARTARLWIKEKGIDIQETVLIPGADRFFLRDPDGNRIEIIEWKEEYPNIPVSSDDYSR